MVPVGATANGRGGAVTAHVMVSLPPYWQICIPMDRSGAQKLSNAQGFATA
jgi:hypothetical protein